MSKGQSDGVIIFIHNTTKDSNIMSVYPDLYQDVAPWHMDLWSEYRTCFQKNWAVILKLGYKMKTYFNDSKMLYFPKS